MWLEAPVVCAYEGVYQSRPGQVLPRWEQWELLNGYGHGSGSGQLRLGGRRCWLCSGPWLRYPEGVWVKAADFVFSWGRMVNLEHRFCDEWWCSRFHRCFQCSQIGEDRKWLKWPRFQQAGTKAVERCIWEPERQSWIGVMAFVYELSELSKTLLQN